MRFLPALIFAIVLTAPAFAGEDNTAHDLAAAGPLIQPQPDGVIYLNVEAATLIRGKGKGARRVNDGSGTLQVRNGHIAEWDGTAERPFWRISVPKACTYQVVINHSTNDDRESTVSVYFYGHVDQRVNSPIESTGSWTTFKPAVLGPVNLSAGEYDVEFQPVEGRDLKYLISLSDVRLIPEDATLELAPKIEKLMDRLGIGRLPDVAPMEQQLRDARQQESKLDATRRTKDFDKFTSYDEFLAYDKAESEWKKLGATIAILRKQVDERRQAKVKEFAAVPGKLDAQDAESLRTYLHGLDMLVESQTKEYPKAFFDRTAAVGTSAPNAAGPSGNTLFAPGHFDLLPRDRIDAAGPMTRLALPRAPDAPQRLQRFQARNSDAALAELGRALSRALIPGTPGLENFEQLCHNAQYRQALEAYRDYFFDKLAHPGKYGTSDRNIVEPLAKEAGKGWVLTYPSDFVLEQEMSGVLVGRYAGQPMAGEVGPPGSVYWAPRDLKLPPGSAYTRETENEPVWKTGEGRKIALNIQFYRGLIRPGGADGNSFFSAGVFWALYNGYVVTGDRKYLDRWCEYLDDWCMNFRRDIENCPANIRCATELDTATTRASLMWFRIALDEHPEFARQFDPATLARYLMTVVKEYPPYTIRAKRAEVANWGIMGINQLLHAASFLSEYKAMTYYRRECWRLWCINFIQHRALDGENLEAWDAGHNSIDVAYANDCIPYCRLPGDADALEQVVFGDGLRAVARNLLTHITPAGDYWPEYEAVKDPTRHVQLLRYTKEKDLDCIADEPEAKRRIETLAAAGKVSAASLPHPTSDLSPYTAMYYLREDWRPEAEFFEMQNPVYRSQDLAIRYISGKNVMGGSDRTMYDLSKNARVLISASPIVVDRKPDNRQYGLIPTGGKTSFCGEAGRNVVDGRFHSSDRFDVAEARQDSPYCRPEVVPERGDFYGIYGIDGKFDNTPVTDVTAVRQVFYVRDQGLYIVNDRILNAGGHEHEYTQFFALPLRLNPTGLDVRLRLLDAAHHSLVDVNPREHRIRSANPGFENVSAFVFNRSPLSFANYLDARQQHAVISQTTTQQLLQTAPGGGKPFPERAVRPVSIHWSGSGNQSLVTMLHPRPASWNLKEQDEGEMKEASQTEGAGGVVGCQAITPDDSRLWFQSGPQTINHLACGPVTAEAEALLVEKPKAAASGEAVLLRGVVLGCHAFAAQGNAVDPPFPDFEFEIGPDLHFTRVEAICRPIDTVQVLPAQNVFTDSVDVSFQAAEQQKDDIELRYTLDGSDPTLHSELFTAPFTLRQTTLVKVRPFRKGLTETPWNSPGINAGKTIDAIFRKQQPLPALAATQQEPGLDYERFEGDWPTLFTYAGAEDVLLPKSAGRVQRLLDADDLRRFRGANDALGVQYKGLIKVPQSGVYAFYAPVHLYTTTMDAGYDLRVFVDDMEWLPSPHLHAENIWFVPLASGFHRLRVAYADYRSPVFRSEYWMSWRPEEMSQSIPVLEVSGPELGRQPLLSSWLYHCDPIKTSGL